MDISKATARPWTNVGGIVVADNRVNDGDIVATMVWSDFVGGVDHANAALIVQAVNSYEPMLNALRQCQSVLLDLDHAFQTQGSRSTILGVGAIADAAKKSSAAIKIAGGKP